MAYNFSLLKPEQTFTVSYMSTRQDHILVVDDDPEIRELVKAYLEKNDYQVSTAFDGNQMWRVLEHSHIDLIVLDIMLPGTDGLELCRTLRAKSKIPVIMLTARGDEMDRVLGLEMGADDYLAKPFSARELLARIKVILRRVRDLPIDTLSETADKLLFANWILDTVSQHLISPEQVVTSLSSAEYRLLHVFLTHPNHALSRDQLLEMTQGRESGPFDRSIDVLVGRLRKRLKDDPKQPELIKTVRGRGYQLTCKVSRTR